MAYVPSSGSIAAWIQSDNASVITVAQSSVAVAIVSGSIAASFTPPANQSVSGTVNIGTQSGSVVAFQGTSPWAVSSGNSSVISLIQGSVAVSVTPVANQSVSGTVQTQLQSTNASVITVNQSSIAAVIIGGSIAASFTPPVNQSVSGTVGSSIIGQLPSGTAVIGSVAVLQGTSPWMISSVYGNVSGSIAGTYVNSAVASTVTGLAVMFKQNVSTSIMTEVSSTFPLPVSLVNSINQSVSGTLGSSIIGQLPGGTAPLGSVATLQGTNPWVIVGSVYGTGSVVAFQGGAPWTQTFSNSSIISINSGSVVALSQGSVIAVFQSSSVITTWKDSSVLSGQQGTWRVSVAGSYASNSASIVSGLGLLHLGVRNNTMASVLASADGSYGPVAVGAWGDVITSAAPQPAWANGVASCFTGVEQPVITSVAGQYINVTGIQVTNASANNTYLSFYGAGLGSVTGSIIGFTVAPANGGSNINFPIPLRTAVGSPFSASVSGVTSVFIAAQGFYSKS